MRKNSIDRNNSVSLPQQISEILRERIALGIYAPNSKMDSLATLTAEFNVSQVTVIRALDILEKQGLIVRVRAKGVYVAENVVKPRYLVLSSLIVEPASQTPFIISGIEDKLREVNIKPEFCSLEAVWERRKEEYDKLFSQFNGIINLGSNWEGNEKLFIALQNLNIPVIHSDSVMRKSSKFTNGAILAIDERDVCLTALKYLRSMGHKRVAFCAYMPENSTFRGFSTTQFVDLLIKEGFDVSPELFLFFRYSKESIFENMKKILALKNPPTAILCYSDYWAFGVMEALNKLKISIPDQISIMGISGFPGGEFVFPPLTTISYEYFSTGRRAAELLLSGDKWFNTNEPLIEEVKHKLIIRSSVKELRANFKGNGN